MSNDTKLIGFDDLNFYLKTFTGKIEKKILKTALSAGAIVIKKQAKKNVAVKSGTLKRAIKHKRLKEARPTVRIFVATGRGQKNDGWYAHIIEGGARPHVITPRKGSALSFGGGSVKSVNHPGIKAMPFMRPAFESKYKEAVIATGNKMRLLIEKEMSI